MAAHFTSVRLSIGTEAYLGCTPRARNSFLYFALARRPLLLAGTSADTLWVEEKAVRAAPGGLGYTKAGAN